MGIVLVHGTGVRLPSYSTCFRQSKSIAEDIGLKEVFVECGWGDPFGVTFHGLSLPDPPTPAQVRGEENDLAHWDWLFDDPLFELTQYTTPDPHRQPDSTLPPEQLPQWEMDFQSIYTYTPSDELNALLTRGGLVEYWGTAWKAIVVNSPIPRQAFEMSPDEIPDVSRALARAIIAELHSTAVDHDSQGPNSLLRQALLNRMLRDWRQDTLGIESLAYGAFVRAATGLLRRNRNSISHGIVLPIGDILLYQTHGDAIRSFIRTKIQLAEPPVTVVAHSLGGIACVDLFASNDPPTIANLVTFGSQAPLLYEIGALYSLKPPTQLPEVFPRWLNIYDRNDFLSYVGSRLWSGVTDCEINSGLPFPESHGAYFGNALFWRKVKDFISL